MNVKSVDNLTSSDTWAASCPTSSQQTATSHPVSPRQAAVPEQDTGSAKQSAEA